MLEMLDHWVFTDDLSGKHLLKADRDLVPGGHCRDVVQHGGRLVEGAALLNIFDEFDAAEVHVVVPVVHGTLLMDTVRHVLRRVAQLTRAKHEGQDLVVVQAPNTVGTSWLQDVQALDQSHQLHVLLEDTVHCGF